MGQNVRLLALCALALLAAVCLAARGSSGETTHQVPEQYAAELAERSQRIQELVAVISDATLADTDRPKLVEAIAQLGSLNAAAAAPALVELLDLRVSASGIMRIGEIPSPQEVYPAVKALIQIGGPAVPAITGGVAARERSEQWGLNAAYTLMEIVGGNEPARTMLVDAAAVHELKARRLQDLAAMIPFVGRQ